MLNNALRPLWLSLLLAATLGASGCTSPLRPAMVAKAQTGDFGYSETRLAEDRYEITYTSPQFRVSAIPSERASRLDSEEQQAHDLALWRAAEITRQAGFAALLVEKDDRNAELTGRSAPEPDPDVPPRCRYWPVRESECMHWLGPIYSRIVPTYITARAVAKLRVQMLKSATAESLDAATTEQRLGAAYGGATYRPQATY